MRRPTTPTRFLLAVLAAVTVLAPLALVPSSWSVAGPAARAAGLQRAASYTCQYTGVESGVTVPGGLPAPVLPSFGGSDPVTVEVRLDAPSKITPGKALKLKGSASFTFGPNATATNASTVFTFLSDSFGLDVTVGSQKRFLRIAELTSSRSRADSSVVTADWTLPDLLIPSTASGQVTLALPTEASVTNPVSTTPESVAFTGELQTDSALQPKREVACALMPNQETAIGTIPVASAAQDTEPSPTPGESEPAAGPPPAGGSTGAGPAPTVPDAVPPGGSPAEAAPVATDAVAAQAVLAAEPIPAATVAQGLRLPPWAMLLIGALLAGGLFLAVASHRRLRQLSAVAAVLALLVVLPTPLNPTGRAEAATGQAQITLVCVYEAEGSDSNDVPKDQPTGLSMTLDVPASVAPGEVLTLTGSASVQAPEDIRNQASQLGYTTLDAISDAFSVGLTVGSGARQVFPADRWQTGKTAFSNPLVVRGPLYFPAFQVPDDASGSIKLELPRNEVVDRRPPPYQNGNTPPKVAVEFLASVTGNGTSATYIVSCWRNDGGSGLIATIPVVEDSGATAATTATDPSAGTTGAEAPEGALQPTTGAGQPAAPSTSPTTGAPVPGEAVTGTAPGTTTVTGAQLQGAAAGPAPVASQDVVVPTWLALVAVLFAVATYGFAGWNHLRMRSMPRRPSG